MGTSQSVEGSGAQASGDEMPPFLATLRPDSGQRRIAAAVIAVSLALFILTAPFAKAQLAKVWAFLPIYQSALVIIELVTAALLLGQFRILRSSALLVLAGGYLFSALMAVAHALSFPDLFAPGGLLGAGPQTTAWLYFLWHGGFSLFIAGYALLKGRARATIPADRRTSAAAYAMFAVLALAGGVTLFATAGHDFLPSIMRGDLDAPTKVVVAAATWLSGIVAIALLWLRRPHSELDLWLMVVMCAWIFDTALASVFNHGRFDLGWYTGRVYGLLAASFVLVMLLFESSRLYAQLAQLHARERERSDEQLRASEERFKATFEQAAVGIGMVTPDGRWLRANRKLCEIVGYAPGELPNMTVQAITHPDDLAAEAALLGKVLAREIDTFSIEKRYLRKDGRTVWVNRTVAPVWKPDGELDYFISIIEDVSARKEAEAALQRERKLLDSVMRTTDVMLVYLDPRFDFVWVNATYAANCGMKPEEMVGRNHFDLYPDAENEAIFRRVRDTGEAVFYKDKPFAFPDQPERGVTYWDWSLAPVKDADGTVSGLVFSLRETTRFKEAEASLQALQAEMEQLMKRHVAGQTIAAIAHELNQPLVAVTSYAEAALRLLRAGNREPELLRQAIEGSASQAQRAGQVVRELLAFMKLGEVQTEPVELNDVVDKVLAQTRANVSGAFQARLDLEPGLPAVRANRLQIEKVLANLIQNGIEAMAEAGVRPQSMTVAVRTGADGSMAQVTVRDSGPGIDAQSAHRIFDPFFTTKAAGFGMGLSISRAMIEAHGGQLWLEVGPGPGATFHFTLPFVS